MGYTVEQITEELKDDDRVQVAGKSALPSRPSPPRPSPLLHAPSTPQADLRFAAGIDVDGVLRGKIMIKDKFLSSLKDGAFLFLATTDPPYPPSSPSLTASCSHRSRFRLLLVRFRPFCALSQTNVS